MMAIIFVTLIVFTFKSEKQPNDKRQLLLVASEVGGLTNLTHVFLICMWEYTSSNQNFGSVVIFKNT